MTDNDSDSDRQGGARMELTPDTLHERDDGYFLDCPACGSTVSFAQIIEEGRCSGVLDGDVAEVESDDEEMGENESGCTAKLSLELVWEE